MTPSHVMAGTSPAIPMRKSTALGTIGITGTRPVMTREGWRAVSFPAGDGVSHRRGREAIAPSL
jgi:hypothetical protein